MHFIKEDSYYLEQESIDADKIQDWLISNLAQQLGIDPSEIDINIPLESYGLNSAQAMFLIAKSEKMLGFQISPMLLWHYPTIQLLAERLLEEIEDNEAEIIEI